LSHRPVAMWLLGHVHAPKLRAPAGSAPVLYPGSPQAMDPGESGAHGAWVVEFRPGSSVAPRLVLTSTVRYEAVSVDVTGVADESQLHSVLHQQVRDHIDRLLADCGPLRHLSLRVTLVGSTPMHRRLEQHAELLASDYEWSAGGISASIDTVSMSTRPVRDFAHLREEPTPRLCSPG
jgi:DNA repair protein SbcD/Mre11